jgi:ribosomal-protein-alanine N-acetyltransferase
VQNNTFLENVDIVPLNLELCEPVYNLAKKNLPEYWSLQSIQDVLKYESNLFFVAKLKSTGQVVGFAGIMIIIDEAELLNIAVEKEYRNLGIGQQLLDCVLKTALRKGAGRMLLEVRQSNSAAIRLYEKNGFVTISQRKDYYSNPKENADIMEKRLEML